MTDREFIDKARRLGCLPPLAFVTIKKSEGKYKTYAYEMGVTNVRAFSSRAFPTAEESMASLCEFIARDLRDNYATGEFEVLPIAKVLFEYIEQKGWTYKQEMFLSDNGLNAALTIDSKTHYIKMEPGSQRTCYTQMMFAAYGYVYHELIKQELSLDSLQLSDGTWEVRVRFGKEYVLGIYGATKEETERSAKKYLIRTAAKKIIGEQLASADKMAAYFAKPELPPVAA